MTGTPDQRELRRRADEMRAAFPPAEHWAGFCRDLAAKGITLDDLKRLAEPAQAEANVDAAIFEAIKAFRESGGESDGEAG